MITSKVLFEMIDAITIPQLQNVLQKVENKDLEILYVNADASVKEKIKSALSDNAVKLLEEFSAKYANLNPAIVQKSITIIYEEIRNTFPKQ